MDEEVEGMPNEEDAIARCDAFWQRGKRDSVGCSENGENAEKREDSCCVEEFSKRCVFREDYGFRNGGCNGRWRRRPAASLVKLRAQELEYRFKERHFKECWTL